MFDIFYRRFSYFDNHIAFSKTGSVYVPAGDFFDKNSVIDIIIIFL